jgi:hypothetical protein
LEGPETDRKTQGYDYYFQLDEASTIFCASQRAKWKGHDNDVEANKKRQILV